MAESSTSKTLLLLILAIVFGIVAAIFAGLYLKSKEQAILTRLAGEEQEMISVVVANQPLPKGLKISENLLTWGEFPSKYVPAGAVMPADYKAVLGRFLTIDLEANKPLLYSFLDEEFPVDFSDLIEKGRRAITVQVDEINSISGFLRPGNRIDVFVNVDVNKVNYKPEGEGQLDFAAMIQEATAQAETGTLTPELAGSLAATGFAEQNTPKDVIFPVIQDVKVLATGREPYDENLDALSYPQRRTERNFTSVTLDVSPEQAALLAMAEDQGDLLAVLRNRKDRGSADFDSKTPFDLYENAKKMRKMAALRKAAAESGATIDENGNWVSADGKVIKGEDILLSENGTVTTKGGQLLGAKGIRMNENGEYVDENGNVIPPDQLVFNEDGTVTTKDDLMKAAGYTINENGDYVDANGNVISKDDVKVMANGTVMSADGTVLSGPKATVNEHGFIIGEDGTVMTADGKVLTGVTVDENGNIIGPDGKIMTDANLIVDADGTVRDKDGNVIAGISGSSAPPGIGEAAIDIADILDTGLPVGFYRLIIGGSSEDGVPKSKSVRVESVKQPPPPIEE